MPCAARDFDSSHCKLESLQERCVGWIPDLEYTNVDVLALRIHYSAEKTMNPSVSADRKLPNAPGGPTDDDEPNKLPDDIKLTAFEQEHPTEFQAADRKLPNDPGYLKDDDEPKLPDEIKLTALEQEHLEGFKAAARCEKVGIIFVNDGRDVRIEGRGFVYAFSAGNIECSGDAVVFVRKAGAITVKGDLVLLGEPGSTVGPLHVDGSETIAVLTIGAPGHIGCESVKCGGTFTASSVFIAGKIEAGEVVEEQGGNIVCKDVNKQIKKVPRREATQMLRFCPHVVVTLPLHPV